MPPIPTATPWLLDSVVTHHHLNDNASNINQRVSYYGNDNMTLCNSASLSILNHSHNKLYVHNHSFNLSNILYTLHVFNNLLSVHHLYTDNAISVEFNATSFVLRRHIRF